MLLLLLMIRMTAVALHLLKFIGFSICFYVSSLYVKNYFSHIIAYLFDSSIVRMDSKHNQKLAESEVIGQYH